jgi:hypothetical protein
MSPVAIEGTDLRRTRRELEGALIDALARGDADPAALKLSARLGAIVAEIGNRHEARRHFKLVAAAGPAVLGADHPLVQQANAFLGDGSIDAPPRRSPAIRPDGREVERSRPSRTGLAIIPNVLLDNARRSGWRTRHRSLVWVVAASAAFAGLAAASVALWPRGDSPTVASTAPSKVVAPDRVSATMSKGVVTVRWQDPSGGTAPFIVSGGVAGTKAEIRQQVDAGQSSVAINGLNSSRDYCFTVVAVYSSDQVAVSDLACTRH